MARSSFGHPAAPGAIFIRSAGNMRLVFPVLLWLLVVTAAAAQQSAADSQSAAITEAGLKQQLVGKYLYLRGGFLDNSLSFNDRGELMGNSPRGSYTLSVIRIDSLSLSRRKLELRGLRYGLHFLGAQSTEGSPSAVDHVRITPRKKWVRITIARMKVVKPPKKRKGVPTPPLPSPQPNATTTTSQAYSASVLRQAIGNVFASTLDARMMAALPACWRLYYQAEAEKTGSGPLQPGVLRISDVDHKPTLIGNLEAPSNQYSQDHGIVGVALYRAVIGADGKPGDIAVARPIGFGLDENAVAAIQTARFEPAMKDGKPVPVLLDLVVEFRIFSKRTEVAVPPVAAPSAQPLPGPYSAGRQ
jgi:TonB family protein